MIMTPGLALFYGGMVSNSNVSLLNNSKFLNLIEFFHCQVLHAFMLSMVTLCLVTVQWLLFG